MRTHRNANTENPEQKKPDKPDLRQYFSLYRAVSQREGETREKIEESKNVQTTTTRTYCQRTLPYYHPNCRTPRHWKFTQDIAPPDHPQSQCRGVLLIWCRVGQGPTALAVGAGGGGLDIFSLVYHFSLLSPSLWEMARYRLKYCLKGPLNQKQPTNQPSPEKQEK